MNFKKIINTIVFLLTFMLILNPIFAAVSSPDYDNVNLDASSYNYNPAPVIPGNEFELWIQLTNNSNTAANNVTYILDLDFPFSLADFTELEQTIDHIAPHQTNIIKYKLKTEVDALAGTYEIDLKFKAAERDETFEVVTYNIDVKTEKPVIELISSNIEDITIGSETKVDLTIKNLDKKTAKNIFVTLADSSDSKVKVINLQTQYIENLRSGQEAIFSYSVIADKGATNKAYSLPLTISYSDSDQDYTLTRNLGIEIKDNPNIIVSILSLADNYMIKPNTEHEIEMEIYNTGNVDSEYVYIEVVSDIADNINNYFIGSIEKDNYDSVNIKFKTKAKLDQEEYPFKIIAHYKDNNLKEQTVTKEVTVSVSNAPKGAMIVGAIQGIIFGILGLIVAVVVLAIIVLLAKWLYKKIVKPAFGINGLKKKKK